ncbi:MAG: ribonuclease HI [Candidatus Paceibacterota bacterium]|jgi:ribonuclease HI
MENIIFTDGSSRGNPGPGGWGAVVVSRLDSDKSEVLELGGGEKFTTNNKMELMATIEGLSHTSDGSACTVNTDSSYVINGITKWIKGWKKNGWKTKTKEDVSNKDLWMKLSLQVESKTVSWKYVGGHIGIVGNERCDEIATAFADGQEIRLYKGPLSKYALQNILDVSHNEEKKDDKKSSSSHSKTKAYSYVSSVGGVIETHRSWSECEKRVKGARGARYKKAISVEDENKIIEEYEAYLI